MRDLQSRTLSDTETRVAWVAVFTMMVGVMAWLQAMERRLAEKSAGFRSGGLIRLRPGSIPYSRHSRKTTFFGQARMLLRQFRSQKISVTPRVQSVSYESNVRAEIDRMVGKGVYGGPKEQL